MDVYLIRHADPDYVKDSLTPLGVQEAQRLADYLRAVPLTHIYCSPLGRAQRTMQPVLAGRTIQPVTLPWLAELVGRMRPELWTWNVTASQLAAEPDLAGHIERFMDDQKHQLVAQWHKLLTAHGCRRSGFVYEYTDKGQHRPVIACFAHAGLILTLLCGLFDWPLAKTYAGLNYRPTGITHLRVSDLFGAGPELRVVSLAARPHLAMGWQ